MMQTKVSDKHNHARVQSSSESITKPEYNIFGKHQKSKRRVVLGKQIQRNNNNIVSAQPGSGSTFLIEQASWKEHLFLSCGCSPAVIVGNRGVQDSEDDRLLSPEYVEAKHLSPASDPASGEEGDDGMKVWTTGRIKKAHKDARKKPFILNSL